MDKVTALVLAALHAIFKSAIFWDSVAGILISVWLFWLMRLAAKSAIEELDIEEKIREAVQDALAEPDESDDDVI